MLYNWLNSLLLINFLVQSAKNCIWAPLEFINWPFLICILFFSIELDLQRYTQTCDFLKLILWNYFFLFEKKFFHILIFLFYVYYTYLKGKFLLNCFKRQCFVLITSPGGSKPSSSSNKNYWCEIKTLIGLF